MATKIITKNSSTATSIPTAGDLVQGELAVNVTDKRLFTEDSGGAIVELGTNPSTLTSGAATFSGDVTATASTGQFIGGTTTGAAALANSTLSAYLLAYGATNTTFPNEVHITAGAGSYKFSPTAATFSGDLITATAGTSNLTLGVNAGNSIIAGGIENTLVGDEAGTAITTGKYNTAAGYSVLSSNTTGERNSAFGRSSLQVNTTGSFNTAVGFASLESNTTGLENTAVGGNSARATTTGSLNTSVGSGSLFSNTTGATNVAIGINALVANTTASNNTAVGAFALTANTTGVNNTAVGSSALAGALNDGNTAVGLSAGGGITTGQYNTAIGLVSAASLVFTGSFNSSIGYNANPSAAGSSGQFTLGDANISNLRCNDTSISSLSDSRDKTDVIDSPYGLNFINTVRPVQFKWETRDGNVKDGSTRIGFLAQELLAATDGNNAVLDLVLDDNPDKLEAKYGNLLPIAIQAIQELSTQLDAALARIETLEGK